MPEHDTARQTILTSIVRSWFLFVIVMTNESKVYYLHAQTLHNEVYENMTRKSIFSSDKNWRQSSILAMIYVPTRY